MPGTAQDFKVYNEQFHAGLWERIDQIFDRFNEATAGTIRLVSESMRGDYEKEAFFKNVSDIVTHRDTTSTSDASTRKVEQDELISVKINRRVGPIDQSLDALKKIQSNQEEFSFMLGEMVAERKYQDILNTGVMGTQAALSGNALFVYDATGNSGDNAKATVENMVNGLSKLGDMGEKISCWVMHSKPFYDLTIHQVTSQVTNIADRVIMGETPATLNRPAVVSDIPALHDEISGADDEYWIIGLVQDGLVLTESEQSDMITEIVTGKDNLLFRMQGEHAYNIGVKGFAWDTSSGGSNPNDSAVGTSGNWNKMFESHKHCAGVAIKCN